MNIENINKWAGEIKSKRMTQADFCRLNDISLLRMRKIIYAANVLSSDEADTYNDTQEALEKNDD